MIIIIVLLIFSALFLFIGLGIGKFKWYWLISGYNMASKEAKQKMDVESAGKYLAKMSYIVATINLIGSFAVYFFQVSVLIFIYLTIAIIFYFTWQIQKFDHSSNGKASRIILVATMIFVVVVNIPIFTAGTKSNEVEFTKDSIKITGSYGRTILKENITEVKLVDNMPKIKLRTNGISLGKVQKGNYKLEGINKGVLFLENYDDGPYMQITTKTYTVFINYKDDSKTTELYNKLDSELK